MKNGSLAERGDSHHEPCERALQPTISRLELLGNRPVAGRGIQDTCLLGSQFSVFVDSGGARVEVRPGRRRGRDGAIASDASSGSAKAKEKGMATYTTARVDV